MWQGKRLSVVLPAYNEARCLAGAIQEFQAGGVADDIVVVDNNSTDSTAQIAREAGVRVVREPRRDMATRANEP